MDRLCYLQGDDAIQFIKEGYCDSCLKPARNWAEPDHMGNYQVIPSVDHEGNLVGFLCPNCGGDV